MKFYGHGMVWDSERDSVLCDFVDGVVETTDKRVITVLKRMNLKYDGDEELEGDEVNAEETVTTVDYDKCSASELKEMLDAHNIKYTSRTSKEELINLLKGVE